MYRSACTRDIIIIIWWDHQRVQFGGIQQRCRVFLRRHRVFLRRHRVFLRRHRVFLRRHHGVQQRPRLLLWCGFKQRGRIIFICGTCFHQQRQHRIFKRGVHGRWLFAARHLVVRPATTRGGITCGGPTQCNSACNRHRRDFPFSRAGYVE